MLYCEWDGHDRSRWFRVIGGDSTDSTEGQHSTSFVLVFFNLPCVCICLCVCMNVCICVCVCLVETDDSFANYEVCCEKD